MTERFTITGLVPATFTPMGPDGSLDLPRVAPMVEHLQAHGVWANKPVPLFPYPGSPGYARQWGTPDDDAWERAMEQYLARFDEFSDIQNARPLPLSGLEHPW